MSEKYCKQIMENPLDNNLQIKEEKYDEFEGSYDDFSAAADALVIKEENFDNDVIYQRVPWDQSDVKDEDILHTALEYDNDSTEIKVEEAVLEDNSQLFGINFYSMKKHKQTKSAKTKKTNKATNTKRKQSNPKPKHFQCEQCGGNFKSQYTFINHQHKNHAKELQIKCRVCTQRFNDMVKKTNHEMHCKIRRYECYLCDYGFLHSKCSRFLVHFRKHTGETPFQCKCCAKKFSSKRMLNFHMKYHPNEIPSKCSFCQRKFSTIDATKEHESNCSLQRKYECYLCKSTFTYSSSIRRHMPQHTGATIFNCEYCKKGYARKEYLVVHLKTKHQTELRFPCTNCDQRISKKITADKHTQSCTKKREFFKCEQPDCNYSTMSKTYADDHRQKHIGVEKFKCLHCSAVFLQRSKLVHHVKTHNEKSQFKCPNCQRVYKIWLYMERHRQICNAASKQ